MNLTHKALAVLNVLLTIWRCVRWTSEEQLVTRKTFYAEYLLSMVDFSPPSFAQNLEHTAIVGMTTRSNYHLACLTLQSP